ncbi:HamA C-terminal domain-containing protein [Haloferula sargassicola]|uniref:Anti-bacteriophage protein A/HamA C-terminal domain-containing protein n=1 Tax=Haloferula sargassicola TaxID=490096 RepID=A0ABP9URI4_9BACT
MQTNQPKLTFEVLIDEGFSVVNDDASITPTANKRVLSMINDFEDAKWRYTNFQNFIWDNIVETALSSGERQSLSHQSHSLLTEAAKALRLTDAAKKDIGKGSELAEIVLYGIMKHHYQALPVVPKIFYKQNNQDNAKGADSVHIVVSGGDFSLWLGEAKFYNDIEDARLGEIVKSVGNALKTDKLKKENSIITNIRDLDALIGDSTMRARIKAALGQKNSIDSLKPHLHIPILMLHECKITKVCTSLTDSYKDSIIDYHKKRAKAYFKKQANSLGSSVVQYSDINFHVILFPVPNKEEIVKKFLANVAHYKGQ